jgi:two-component system alkaline phosphatase synthesis response regulator PhoP
MAYPHGMRIVANPAMNRRMHILLADDETAFRFSASVALRGAGYRVSVAKNGREAFSRIMKSHADGDPVQVLVTDQQMPEMTGTELASLLHDRGIRIPVVVVTAFHDRHAAPGFPPGAIDELIEKPIEPEDLVACLNRVTKPSPRIFS